MPFITMKQKVRWARESMECREAIEKFDREFARLQIESRVLHDRIEARRKAREEAERTK